jgi:hypothetical protein
LGRNPDLDIYLKIYPLSDVAFLKVLFIALLLEQLSGFFSQTGVFPRFFFMKTVKLRWAFMRQKRRSSEA